MAEERKKKRKKHRGHRHLSGPQFATHVYGGGYYLGPGFYGYSTAQNPNPEQGGEDPGGGAEGGEGLV